LELYEKMPVEFLLRFYSEIIKNIENGILSKNMYYELGVIISVANRREICLDRPSDFYQVVNQHILNGLLQSEQVECEPHSA
jgi:hypothetical protein